MSVNRVLIADDEPLARWAVARRIEEIGGQAVEAASRAELERHLLLSPPIVVVTSFPLGGESVVDLLRALSEGPRPLPLILLCPEDCLDESRREFPEALVLQKPFCLETIAETVRQLLPPKSAGQAG